MTTQQKPTNTPSENTPGVKEQGSIKGASHANQGNWDTKEGKPLAPPKDGQVSKPTSETEKSADEETTGKGAEVAGGP